MKASELIAKLSALIAEHGDLEVTYDGGYGRIYEEEVDYCDLQLGSAPPPSFTVNF